MKVLTIGGALQDITFQTKEGVLINNQQDILRQQLLGFELKAKINIERANFTFGGGAANAAVNFANLGNSVSALVCVGDDPIGQEIIGNLKKHNIKTSLVQTSDKRSGLSFVINAENLGEEHILFTFRGANDDLDLTRLDFSGRNFNFDFIYLTSLSGKKAKINLARVFRWKDKFKNVKIAWNPGNLQIRLGLDYLKLYLRQTDIFIVNKDEAIEICTVNRSKDRELVNPRVLLKRLAEFCLGVVIITDGSNGVYCYYKKKIYFEPALKVKKKDTTGVGDAFGSTFSWILEHTHYDIQRSLKLANKNAAAVLKQVGAQNGLLSKTKLLYG